MLQRSGTDPLLGPLTKLALTELTSRLTDYAVDALGPEGMLAGSAGDDFLYAPGMRLAGGTSEIQRNLVGERLLGLPRERSRAERSPSIGWRASPPCGPPSG